MRTLPTRRARRAALLAIVAGVAACDFPSEPPVFQQTWIVPADSVRVGVAELLPTNVALNGGGTAFVVTTQPANFSSTLGALCGQAACQSPGTVNAPVPAFTSTAAALQNTIALPANVTMVDVAAGATLTLAITNNLGFDPLRPNGVGNPPFGSIAITISNPGQTATTTFTGATQGLPNGATTNLQVPLPAGGYTGAITVSAAFDVPAGGNANLSASNGLSVTATLSNLTVTQANVMVANDSISTAPTELDLSDLEFVDEVQSGGIIIQTMNPLSVNANVQVTLTAPAQGGSPQVTIVKNLAITGPNLGGSTTLTYSQSELRSVLGKSGVSISIRGTASSATPGDPVNVTPASAIVLKTLVSLVLNVGS